MAYGMNGKYSPTYDVTETPYTPEPSPGHTLPDSSEVEGKPEQQSQTPNNTSKLCPLCRKSLQPQFLVCPYCGAVLKVRSAGS
jgi:hypothetical protein